VDIPEVALPDLNRLALLLVDVQQGFDDTRRWGVRNNRSCESNIALLLRTWREHHRPVVFVRHDSTDLQSPLHPGQPGNTFKPVLTDQPDLLITKTVNSCFHGTPNLDSWLRAQDLDGIVIAGITTNHCCETTARIGGNLGHQVLFVLDATHTFDRTGPDGTVLTADELTRATATNLHQEFATVVTTAHLTASRRPTSP